MTTAEDTAQTPSQSSGAPHVVVEVPITAAGVLVEQRVDTEVAYVDQLTAAVNDIECFSHDLCLETGHALIPREVVLDRIRQVAGMPLTITSSAERDLRAHLEDLLNETELFPLAAQIRAVLDRSRSDITNTSTQGDITV